jgi:hypothetical protein
MEILFLGSKKNLHIVESLLNSQPPCGIIRTTADYSLPYMFDMPIFQQYPIIFCTEHVLSRDWVKLQRTVPNNFKSHV